LSLTSLLSAPEREVTSPSDFKVVGALLMACVNLPVAGFKCDRVIINPAWVR
jgi:hypothetical protein